MAEAERSKEDPERRITELADTMAKDEEQTYVDVDFDSVPDPTVVRANCSESITRKTFLHATTGWLS
eukprot:12397986-Karenia_brevis.AAC.1